MIQLALAVVRSDLIISLEWHEETAQTDTRRTVATSSRCFFPAKLPEKLRKCTEGKSFERKGCSHQMLISFS